MNIIAIVIIAAAVPWALGDSQVVLTNDTPAAEVSCLTRSEHERLDEIERKINVLYAAHTNRLVRIESHKKKIEERKRSAVERVMENAKNRKRKSAVGRSAGGVR